MRTRFSRLIQYSRCLPWHGLEVRLDVGTVLEVRGSDAGENRRWEKA